MTDEYSSPPNGQYEEDPMTAKVLNPEEARQGRKTGHVRLILLISFIGVIIAFSTLGISWS